MSVIEAISEFASRAAEKLRRQSSLAGQILVFAHTSPFRPGPRFSKSVVIPLRRPTADSRLLVQSAVSGIRQIYQPGFLLSKAGVMLLDLTDEGAEQCELDLEPDEARDRTKLMVAMDAAMLQSLYHLLPPPLQQVLIGVGCAALGLSMLWSVGHLLGLV